MRRTTLRAFNLTTAAVVLGVVGACSPSPPTPPPTTQGPLSSQATPTDAPSASAVAGPRVAWEPYLRLGGMIDMVHGEAGWVALGECQPGSCGAAGTVWHSEDLEAWATIELPQSGDIAPISVSASDDGYLIGAYDYDEVGGRTDAFLQVWRSFDGRSWDRVGELRLGPCNDRGCPVVRGVGVAPNGAYVVGAVVRGDDDAGPSFVSDDGFTWRETTIATFSQGNSLDEIRVQGTAPTPSDLFVVGWACSRFCDMTVWSTRDGEHWVEEQGFATGINSVSVASDGGQRVAAVSTCSAPETGCTTDVFTGVRSTIWTNVAPALDLAAPEVVWTGNAFVLVGTRDARFVSFVSPDGLTWTEVPGDTLGGPDGCGQPWLAGDQRTVMFGVPGCSIWKGSVQ